MASYWGIWRGLDNNQIIIEKEHSNCCVGDREEASMEARDYLELLQESRRDDSDGGGLAWEEPCRWKNWVISPAWKTEQGRIPTALDLREERKRGLRDGNFWIWGQSNSINGAINGLEKTPRREVGLRKKEMGNIKYLLYYEGGEVYEVSKGTCQGLSMIGHIKRTT